MNIWVAKSLLQKSVRRGIRSLIIESFERIWAEEPEWLIRRLMIFPTEDAWKSTYAIGHELYLLKQEGCLLKKGDKVVLKKRLLAILLKESKTKKNKDGNNIRQLARLLCQKNRAGKTKYTKGILGTIEGRVDPSDFKNLQYVMSITDNVLGSPNYKANSKKWWNRIWNSVDEHVGSKGYQKLRDAVGAVYFRSLQGGCEDTHLLFLSVAVLIIDAHARGYSLEAEKSLLTGTKDSFGESYKNTTWWASDMHTSKGKKVLGLVTEKYSKRYSASFIEELWFLKETALVNEDDPNSVWLTLQANVHYNSEGVHYKDIDSIWSEVGQDIKSRLI